MLRPDMRHTEYGRHSAVHLVNMLCMIGEHHLQYWVPHISDTDPSLNTLYQHNWCTDEYQQRSRRPGLVHSRRSMPYRPSSPHSPHLVVDTLDTRSQTANMYCRYNLHSQTDHHWVVCQQSTVHTPTVPHLQLFRSHHKHRTSHLSSLSQPDKRHTLLQYHRRRLHEGRLCQAGRRWCCNMCGF